MSELESNKRTVVAFFSPVHTTTTNPPMPSRSTLVQNTSSTTRTKLRARRPLSKARNNGSRKVPR